MPSVCFMLSISRLKALSLRYYFSDLKLRQQKGSSTVITLGQAQGGTKRFEEALKTLPGLRDLSINGLSIELKTDSDMTAMAVRLLVNKGADIVSVNRNDYQLDDI